MESNKNYAFLAILSEFQVGFKEGSVASGGFQGISRRFVRFLGALWRYCRVGGFGRRDYGASHWHGHKRLLE